VCRAQYARNETGTPLLPVPFPNRTNRTMHSAHHTPIPSSTANSRLK